MKEHIEHLTHFYESIKNDKKRKKTKSESHILNDKYYLKEGDLTYEFERKQYMYNKTFLNEIDAELNKLKKKIVGLKYDLLYELKENNMEEYDSLEERIKELCEQRNSIIIQLKTKETKKNNKISEYLEQIKEKMFLYKESSIEEKKILYVDIKALHIKINKKINKYISILPIHSESSSTTYSTIVKDYTPIYGNEIYLIES